MQFDRVTIALLILRTDAPVLDETEEAALQDAHMPHCRLWKVPGGAMSFGPAHFPRSIAEATGE